MWESIKLFGKKAVNYVAAMPPSTVIKAGIIVGVAVFTAVILVKHVTKVYKDTHNPRSVNRSPVDEILGVNYVTDSSAFEELDPEAQRICRELNKAAKKKKRGTKASKHKLPKLPKKATPVVSLFDGPAPMVDEDDIPVVETPRYADAHEMMWKEARAPKKATKRRRKAPIDREHLLELKQICDEWKSSGRNAEAYRGRVDAIAKELGLSVDTLDQAVNESMRAEFGALF